GLPRSEAEFAGHRFVGIDADNARAPFHIWLRSKITPEQLMFRGVETAATRQAILSGAGIGFLSVYDAVKEPELVEVMPTRPEWDSPLWLVTHVDLHRTRKVQAFLAHLKEAAKGWGAGVQP
ncbi:MAG: LysR substrate-binding domain-containing protein, partial [Paracoccaceae bacterium]